MTEQELINRMKQMALHAIKLVQSLPKNDASKVLGRQLLRSATSTAANYRAACKARSHKDFINKLGIAEEEADETQFWLEMISDTELSNTTQLNDLLQETKELTAILAASRITAQKRSKK